MALNDTFYVSHGSPTLTIDEDIKARQFFQSWKEKIFSQRPKAILCISAHYDTTHPTVNVVSGPNNTIYDFYGFPSEMYKVIKLKKKAVNNKDSSETKMRFKLNSFFCGMLPFLFVNHNHKWMSNIKNS